MSQNLISWFQHQRKSAKYWPIVVRSRRGRPRMKTSDGLLNTVTSVLPAVVLELGRHPIYGNLPEDLRLRTTACGMASRILTKKLREGGVESETQIASFPDLPRGINHRTIDHVVVAVGGAIIDLTYTQFYSFVGLTPELAARDDRARQLYPQDAFALVEAGKHIFFGNQFAEKAQQIQMGLKGLGITMAGTLPPTGALWNASPDDLRKVYTKIWDPKRYQAIQD